ncbi:MAG: YceI family protein [Rudaea sp.]
MKRFAIALLLLASLPAFAAEKYNIDRNHTAITFHWNHLGFSNPSARLEKFSGEFLFDKNDPTKSSITVTLPLDGLHTGVEKLDADLKAEGFFDAAKYPNITFTSTKVEKAGTGRLKITGDLTIHGVTKSVVLNAKINKIGDNPMMKIPSAGFDADTVIKRSDFGVGRLVPMVSDEIPVHITLDSHLAR